MEPYHYGMASIYFKMFNTGIMKKIFTLLFTLATLLSYSQSTTIVISQIYGAGGNSGAVYNADYVELHNLSGTAQSLSGLSIQYTSATSTGTWTGVFALPAASIPAGGYYLVQMSNTGANGVALPTVDATATPAIAMSATAGKVAIINGTTAVTGCITNAIDLVGYGTTANCSEGGAPTPAPSATLAIFRANNGCTDTDNNGADFASAAPAPRNSATAIFACGALAPSLNTSVSTLSFGNVLIGSTSASQSYDLSGADLTGAPGDITVTASSADFQVSNDNSTWGASTTIAFTSATLAATPVWVRFAPQAAGPISGTISNAGGGVTTAVVVNVNGTGDVPPTPTLSATSLTAFGNICLNATAGPNSFTVNGLNLTNADITVGPLAGFSFSTTSGGTYTPSLTLTQAGGTYTQQIFVTFTPTAIQAYDGNIPVSGGGATAINVAAAGSGANNPPTVTTGAASGITVIAATLAGDIPSNGCTAVTAYGIEYSLTSGFTPGTGTQVASTNLSGTGFTSSLSGLVPATTYYYVAYATNAGGTTYGLQQSFTTATPSLTATTLDPFGDVCTNTTTDAKTFTISSTGLNATNVTVGPLTGYSFSLDNATYTNTLSIAQPGGPFNKVIYVKASALAVQSYNGNIPVSGGGAPVINVAASANGVNTAPTVITGDAVLHTPNTGTFSGTITDIGCTLIIGYGIEYSGISGFTPGIGTKAGSINIAGGEYTVDLNNLAPATTYYYRAYASNNGGVSYGIEKTFTTAALPTGLVVYSSPITRGGTLHYSLDNVKPGHYQVRIINSIGQEVYRHDVITQVGFINDYFVVPSNIGTGAYTLQLVHQTFKVKESKRFMIR